MPPYAIGVRNPVLFCEKLKKVEKKFSSLIAYTKPNSRLVQPLLDRFPMQTIDSLIVMTIGTKQWYF